MALREEPDTPSEAVTRKKSGLKAAPNQIMEEIELASSCVVSVSESENPMSHN